MSLHDVLVDPQRKRQLHELEALPHEVEQAEPQQQAQDDHQRVAQAGGGKSLGELRPQDPPLQTQESARLGFRRGQARTAEEERPPLS